MKYLIRLKWKYLRFLTKRRIISFRKCLLRFHYIEEIRKLNKYDDEKLSRSSYNKLRHLFIKEYPEAYLHNPNKL